MARVQVINEVTIDENAPPGEFSLWFQWCRYFFDDGHLEHGYRFIWKRPDGSLQAARGQARIPSVQQLELLVKKARKAGWGDYDGDDIDSAPKPGA
jgi:hypothetical protein